MSRKLAIADHCSAIADRFEAALAERGQHTMRSFDLQSARAASLQECPCPHHHTSDCSCQYLVLIVYVALAERPRTVVLHEFEGVTRITLDDPDGTLADLLLEEEGNMSQAQVKRKGADPAFKSPWPFVVMAIGAVVIIVIGFLALRGGNSSPSVGAPQTTGGARLNVDRTTIDFGKVPLDKMVKAEFKIKNVGNQPLIIKGEPRVELIKGC